MSLYLVKSGKNQPDNVKNANLVIIAGYFYLITGLILNFLPLLTFYNVTPGEYQFYKGYQLFTWIFYSIIWLVSFGILFIIFAYKNREIYKNYLLTGAFLMCVAFILQIIVSTIFYTLCLDDIFYDPFFTIEGHLDWYIYFALNDILLTVYALSVAFFVVHSKINQDKFMLRASLLIIVRHLTGMFLNIMIFLFGT